MSLRVIRQIFADFPAQSKLAEKMLSLGLRIDNNKVCCGPVEIKNASLAKACGVDRRVVQVTLKTIKKNSVLSIVFSTLEPAGPFYLSSAPLLGLHVLEITPPNAAKPGIVADVTAVLAKHRLSIRQIFSQDPELFENPKLFIVLEKRLPARVFEELSALKVVKKLSVY